MREQILYLAHNLPFLEDPFLAQLIEQYYGSISPNLNYYRFLYGLVSLCKPSLALEIGVELGVASAHMASAASAYGGHVVGVDHNFHHVPGRLIGEIYGNYDFVVGESLDAQTVLKVKDLVARYGPIGVVYQDSSHHYVASIREWETYSAFLGEGAIWVCDDITPAFHDPKIDPPGKGMVQYFEGLPGEKMLIPDILHTGNTIGVVVS
uniref:Putative methyltransferase n=1 Tax=viral metagenome TaxID=1070528 RepID=A0A6M3M3S4_9ZZZZ